MDKATFLSTVDTSRKHWDTALEGIDQATMLDASAADGWTIKDIVAHVVWHEQEMARLLQTRSLESGSRLWELPLDERNGRIYAENRNRPLDEVLSEARQVYPPLRALLDRVTDEDLKEPKRFKGMPGDWLPWRIIAENTYEHYDDHLRSLQRWAQIHPR
jgi:hypothetical protein